MVVGCRKWKISSNRQPMTALSGIQFALWMVAPLLQTVIAAAMVCRRLYRTFPLFFCYTLFHIVQVLVAFTSERISYSAYFYVYWGSELIDALLALAVIQELFNSVFREHDGLRGLGGLLFRWATMVLLALAVGVAVSAPGTDTDRVIAGLVVLQRSVALVQAGLLLLLFGFCRFFGLNWRTAAFGVAFGFGVSAIIQTGMAALRSQIGTAGDNFYSLAQPLAYNVAIGIWVFCMLSPSRKLKAVQVPDSEQLTAWNRALQDLLRT